MILVMDEFEVSGQQVPTRKSGRFVVMPQWLVVLVCVALIITVGAVIWLGGGKGDEPAVGAVQSVPASIASQVKFPVFFPKQLPSGMTVDGTSFSATDQVATYSVHYDQGRKLLVSVQARSIEVDPDDYEGDSTFSTSVGKVVIINLADRTTAAVFGDKSWALINAPDPIADSQLRAFIDSLR